MDASIIGAAIVLLAFFLAASGKIDARGRLSASLNLLGAILLAYAAYLSGGHGFLILNIIWAGVALFSLIGRK